MTLNVRKFLIVVFGAQFVVAGCSTPHRMTPVPPRRCRRQARRFGSGCFLL